ncbi:MAG: hypothetical protein N2747_00015 [Chitinophagaceae bacterium]|nr:hypothetical protein [Chitinophagaceae bacterium]
MLKRIFILLFMLAGYYSVSRAQTESADKKFKVRGRVGVTYEHYALDRTPDGWPGFPPRKPWNQVRFNWAPEFQFPKWRLPVNFNFATTPTNFVGPFSGIQKQSFSQYITNPMNNFALNPTFQWGEIQLGTQYLNYSELSTGDIGIFGAGFDLRPKTYRIKFFGGISNQAVNFFNIPGIDGAYRRWNWMFQLGKEKEGKYSFAVNFVKGKDDVNSVTSVGPNIKPQEGITMSVVSKVHFAKAWYVSAEGAQSIFTQDLNQPADPDKPSLKPFIKGYTSTRKDYAGSAALGRNGKRFDISLRSKYIGAGFRTTGFPFMLPDRLDLTVNTRLLAWKNKDGVDRMNITASAGQRINNLSSNTVRAKQFIGNLNWFTQFNEHWSLNINYNNFGFQTPSGFNPYGIKNVSNDFGINPSYSFSTEKMIHFFSLSYNYSKYDERDVVTGNTTTNNTHSAMLSWTPTFLKKNITPDFSVLYFRNTLPGFRFTILSFNAGLSLPDIKNKLSLRAQAQYQYSKNNTFTPNHNVVGSLNADWKLTKKLIWNFYAATNRFRYGNETTPQNAGYLESDFRTGFQYRFD